MKKVSVAETVRGIDVFLDASVIVMQDNLRHYITVLIVGLAMVFASTILFLIEFVTFPIGTWFLVITGHAMMIGASLRIKQIISTNKLR